MALQENSHQFKDEFGGLAGKAGLKKLTWRIDRQQQSSELTRRLRLFIGRRCSFRSYENGVTRAEFSLVFRRCQCRLVLEELNLHWGQSTQSNACACMSAIAILHRENPESLSGPSTKKKKGSVSRIKPYVYRHISPTPVTLRKQGVAERLYVHTCAL